MRKLVSKIPKSLRAKVPKAIKRSFWKGVSLFETLYAEIKGENLHGKSIKKIVYVGVEFNLLLDAQNGLIDDAFYRSGVFEPDTLEVIKKYSSPDGTFIDVGANIGGHSLFASYCHKEVIAFEPMKRVFGQFVRSIRMNKKNNIIALNLGVSDKRETATIHHMPGNIGGSSIIPKYIPKEASSEEIFLVSLDDFLPPKFFSPLKAEHDNTASGAKVSFIKIDIEGYEYFALNGMKRLLALHKPVLLVEFSPYLLEVVEEGMSEKLLRFLHDRDYRVTDLSGAIFGKSEVGIHLPEGSVQYLHLTNLVCVPSS